jgi:hypothetical protein
MLEALSEFTPQFHSQSKNVLFVLARGYDQIRAQDPGIVQWPLVTRAKGNLETFCGAILFIAEHVQSSHFDNDLLI